MMRTVYGRSVALALLVTSLYGCATAEGQGQPATAAPPTAAAAEAPRPPAGPKKRVAVIRFDAAGNFLAQYGGWDLGGGLAAQLTTALVNSGYFIVVERAELASVLREQEMSLQKIVSRETVNQVSRVLGAQLLVRGAVTEFEQKASGGGLRLGVGVGISGGALGLETVRGSVGMDVRLIDATTGQVVQSHRVESKVDQRGIAADINVSQVSFGGDVFNRTPLGQATREAIAKAVSLIIQSSETLAWSGRVVDVDGQRVYINAGTAAGLKLGDVFTVSAVMRELTDPDSGALLGVIEAKMGEVEVESVQDKFSVARMRAPFQTKRGDLVRTGR